MSAYHTSELAEEALASGASQVISKPLDMDDLGALVHGVASLN